MRVMVVGRGDSVRAVQHAAFLASAGWRVWLADTVPGGGDPSASAVVDLLVPRPAAAGPGGAGDAALRAARDAVRRTRTAFERTAMPVSGAVHAMAGAAPGGGRAVSRGIGRLPGAASLLDGDAPSGLTVGWLADRMRALEVDLAVSFESAEAAPLVDAAVRMIGGRAPAHVVVRDPGSASPSLRHLPTVRGAVEERPPGGPHASPAAGGEFLAVRVATPVGGWPALPAPRSGRTDRPRIVLDCQPGEDHLALPALRGVELAADRLRDGEVAVVGAGEDVRLAARLLAARTGLAVAALDRFPRGQAEAAATCVIAMTGGAAIPAALVECIAAGGIPIGAGASTAGWIRDGENGLAVRAEDPESVAAAIARAIDDGSLRSRAAAANAALAARWLAPDAVAPALLDLYAGLAGRR